MKRPPKRKRATAPTDLALGREHKNSAFCSIFSEKKNFAALYSSITGFKYSKDTAMERVTLPDAFTKGKINDVAFLVDGKLVVFVEHQSTINYNMPIRMFMYAGKVYEMVIDNDALYNEKAIELPDAEFYVIYNGKKRFPEQKQLRLSDMRSAARKKYPPKLELVVDIYNINKGSNSDLLNKCKVLYEYQTIIDLIRKYEPETGDSMKAYRRAVAEYKKHGISEEFIKHYASELENMILTEWNWDDAKRVWQKEAWEDGREEGREEGIGIGVAKGRQEGRGEALGEVFALLEKGIPLAEAKQMLYPKPTLRKQKA